MVTNILFVIGLVILAYLFARIVDTVRKRNKITSTDRISFRETLDLTELPIVTFRNNDKKFNFLLDTGATNSVINKSTLSDMVFNSTNKKDTIYGSDGHIEEVDIVSIDIKSSWDLLGSITGASYQDELVDQIFSNFCLGK